MVPGKFRLKYKTDTEQGVSGSPIWGISEKSCTVVGIQYVHYPFLFFFFFFVLQTPNIYILNSHESNLALETI